jgi:ferric-dicitrate binding protein FerR (iron transport regulator)
MSGIRTIAALATGWLLAMAASAEPVGFVAAVRGMADMGQLEQPVAMATVDRQVSVGDVIETHANAWIKVLLNDDTILAVDANSRVMLQRFARDTTSTRIDLLKGQLRTRVAEGFGRLTRLEVRTPNAAIVARGTEWLTWFEAETTWVCSVRGEVAVHSRADESRTAGMPLRKGGCARVSPDGSVAATARPPHLSPVAMRPGAVKEPTTFPARPADMSPRDQIILGPNDKPRERIEDPAFTNPASPPAATAVP